MLHTWRLRGTSEDNAVELRLGYGVHVLGSSAGSDLRVIDPTVSRNHARLTCSDEGVTIEDLGSTNGTAVDGRPVDGAVLVQRHAQLKIGKLIFKLEPIQVQVVEESSIGLDTTSGGSMLLGPATFGFLRNAGEEVRFFENDVIIRRGEHNEFFFVVIEGQVELALGDSEDRGRPLARIGEGGIFGAESVLGKEGAAINAIAMSDVRLLRYPASALPTALQESASLRKKLLGGIVRHLHKTTSDALDLMRGAKVIAQLVQGDSDPDELIAVSPRMKAIQGRITTCSEHREPVLVLGEDGTGKTLVARLIHDGSPRSKGPLIAVNCRELTAENAAELILGEDLGGRLPRRQHVSGGIHLAHNGTLVLRGAEALEPAVQQMIAAYLRTESRREPGAYPDTRFIVTARAASSADDLKDGVLADLATCFDQVIEIPPLGKRPKDILPLAEEFLRRQGPKPPVITEGARHALLSLRYQRRNVAELREVLNLAARISDGPEIRAEHVFGGVGEDEAPPGMDITTTPVIKRLLRRTGLPVLRGVTLAGFAAAIIACLAFASSWTGRAANTAIWSLWEPAVFALFFIAGPVWCTVCPLSTAARLAKRLGASDRPPPPWLIRHGPWLAVVGFALIVWVERVFNSVENPVASGLLLASLLAAAMLGAMLFRREVWCRHLCPLGRLATTLAPASPIQVTAKQRVCASTCTTHACYKGTPEISGCTVFHHPLEGKQSFRCKLCLDCLQSCPHHSAQLQIRAPLLAVWRLDSSATDLALFASAVSILAMGAVASRTFEALSRPLAFSLMCVLALVAGFALHLTIMRTARTDRRVAEMVQLAMTIMILGWSALMVSQLANIVVLNRARIVISPPSWLPTWMPSEISLLLVLQIGVVLLGLAIALFSLGQIRFERTSFWTRIGRRATPLIFAGYAAVLIALLLV